jgi:hypothetical protein
MVILWDNLEGLWLGRGWALCAFTKLKVGEHAKVIGTSGFKLWQLEMVKALIVTVVKTHNTEL